jgi:hypothetical protein
MGNEMELVHAMGITVLTGCGVAARGCPALSVSGIPGQ